MHVRRTPKEFSALLSGSETILWSDQPVTLPFLATGLPFLAIGLLWGLFDFAFIRLFIGREAPDEMMGFIIPFFLLHTFPCWGSALNILRLALVAGKTCYAFTSERLLIKGGAWGGSLKSIRFEEVVSMDVTVNPLESVYGVGTIRINTGATRYTRRGRHVPVYDTFSAIRNPYEVYRQLQAVEQAAKDRDEATPV